MIAEAASRAVMRAYYRLRAPGSLDELDGLAQSQWQPAETLAALQLRRLRALLAHAETHVPYYRRLLRAAGAEAGDFRSIDDLRRLPVLNREALRGHAAELVDERLDRARLLRNATGGSTGTPVTFYQDREYWRVGFATMWRAWLLFPGYDLGVRHVRFWGADRDQPHPLLRAAGRLLFNEAFLNSFSATPAQLDRALDVIERTAPRLLIAYASSAELLARHARARGRRLRIPSIVSSAETLTVEQRALLVDTFGSRVHDCYGCREVGAIGQECGVDGGLHVNVETQVVELEPVDAASPDGPCRVLVTHLFNRAMPLIRYDLGDTVASGGLRTERCGCGRSMPRMARVAGRVCDIIRTPRGALVHGEYFTHLFYGQEAVNAFQVHQRDLDRLVLRIVPGPQYADRYVDAVADVIRRDHGFTTIDVELCDAIAPESSGKLRFTRSDLDPRNQQDHAA